MKIVLLLGSLGMLIYLVIYTSPELGNVLLFSLLLFLVLSIVISFFFNTLLALLVAISASFFLFLRAVGLLSFINVALFVVFLILLALYLRKR